MRGLALFPSTAPNPNIEVRRGRGKKSEAPQLLRVPRSAFKTSSLNIGDLERRIKEHDAGVRKNPRDRVCYRTVCAGCGKKAPVETDVLVESNRIERSRDR